MKNELYSNFPSNIEKANSTVVRRNPKYARAGILIGIIALALLILRVSL